MFLGSNNEWWIIFGLSIPFATSCKDYYVPFIFSKYAALESMMQEVFKNSMDNKVEKIQALESRLELKNPLQEIQMIIHL